MPLNNWGIDMNIRIKNDNFDFKFRVSGIFIKDNKILLVDMDDSGFLCLPGGHVELGERTEQALLRELLEETKKEVKIKKYLGVMENYFVNKYSIKVHEICFYYLIDFVENIKLDDFTVFEDDNAKTKLEYHFIDIKDIDKYDVRPRILKEIVKNDLEFKHYVIEDIR